MKKILFFTLTVLSVVTYLGVPTGSAQSDGSDPIVRLIYFLPSDRSPQPNIDERIDRLIKEAQQIFAGQMEHYGFGRKAFQFETDRRGNAVVHHVNGRFENAHYLAGSWWKVSEEVDERFDRSTNIYLIFLDTDADDLDGAACGYGGPHGAHGGAALIPAAGGCFEEIDVTIHELGHAFGLAHDYRNNLQPWIDLYCNEPMTTSSCAAEWLDAHRYFNDHQTDFDEPTTVKMLQPRASHSDSIRFEITDSDGLHQVQLFANVQLQNSQDVSILDCKSLDGSRNIVEFAPAPLVLMDNSEPLQVITDAVILRVIDVHGNFTQHEFSIDITRLLSRGEVVSIPDANLAAVLKETLELAPRASITQLDMLKLTSLEAVNHQIADLTGLKHAKNLKSLNLGGNQIRDVTPLVGLLQLQFLELWQNQISDIRPLIGLRRLRILKFADNPISDTGVQLQTLRQNNPDLRTDADPKIEGPWLWMIAATEQKTGSRAASGKDWLAAASEGSVTEVQIATDGATAGERVKNRVWTSGRLAPTGGNNIGEVVNTTGLGEGYIANHVAYGSIVLDSPRKQNTWMYAGSDDNHRVWLNGELIHEQLNWKWGHDYQESFPVTLKQGKNVLLVAIQNDGAGPWGGYFGFEYSTVYSIIGDTSQETVPEADPVLAGPKIEGPWLWMIAATEQRTGSRTASGKDWLAAASNGSVTEVQIATNGAIAGERVQNRVWTSGRLAPTGGNNIGEVVNTTGLEEGYIANHVAYGSIILKSPQEQNTWMYAGSDDNHRVWLNGELIHEQLNWKWGHDYQESFPVTLKQGKNVLLVAIQNEGGPWGGYFGFENDAVYSILTRPIVHIESAQRPSMYWIDAEAGTLHQLVSAEVEDLVPGIQNAMHLTVDSTGNKIYWTEQTGKNSGNIKRANLDGSNVQILATLQGAPTSFAVDTANSKLYWTTSSGKIRRANLNGENIQALLHKLNAPSNITLDAVGGKLYWTEASERIRRANLDGKSVQNVASDLDGISGLAIAGNKIYWTEGTTGEGGKIGYANLNGSNSGTVVRLEGVPSSLAIDAVGNKFYWTESDGSIRRANFEGKSVQTVVSGLASPAALVLGNVMRGLAAPLNHTLAFSETVIPAQTLLLSNYPNPFNPETWIPYQLAESSDVKITIYDTRGVVVRHLALGHQPAGTYTSRSRAAYWDGCNALGESVASGVYFYTFTAGELTATRKMLIRK